MKFVFLEKLIKWYLSEQIPVVVDLPVGLNLQDHPYVYGLEYTLSSKIGNSEKKSKSLWALFDYLIFGKGIRHSSFFIGYIDAVLFALK